jgi:hypothetical protein
VDKQEEASHKQERRMTDAEAARRAAIVALVSNGVYLALMIGLTAGVAKRHELRGLYLRLRKHARGNDRAELHDDQVRAFRRQISEWEHQPPGERV